MNMAGKTVLITGSTDGVGRYVAMKLASAGARVLIHGRDTKRAQALADEIKRVSGREPMFYQADLSSLAEVREFAQLVLDDQERLDVLVSNAGIGSQNEGPARQTSKDGHELRFAVNYLAASCSRICCCRGSRRARRRASSMSRRSASTRSISPT